MKLNSSNINLNLRHLRALHMIAQTGSFARAAEQLGIVPSALSEIISQLEESAGIALFDRKTRPPQLTPAGRAFIQETSGALSGLDQAIERLTQSASMEHGSLRIGGSPSIIGDLLAPALARFRKRWPLIDIELQDGPAEELARLVTEGPLDLAIAGYSGHSALLECQEIARDPFGLALGHQHALTRLSRPVQIADIDPNEVIHLDQTTGSARMIAEHNALPLSLRTGNMRVSSTFGQLCLIRSGMGVGLLPQRAVLLFDDPKLRFLPITDLQLERRLWLLRPKRRAVSHVVASFNEILHAQLAAPTAPKDCTSNTSARA